MTESARTPDLTGRRVVVPGEVNRDLRFELVVSESIPLALTDRLPDGGGRTWAPTTSTLLIGAAEVVLIDPPLTSAQADVVVQRIRALGRRLTHIVATHAHGDHWFSAAWIAARFQGAQVVALRRVIEAMRHINATRPAFWDRILPGQIPASPVTATAPVGGRVELEGHAVELIAVGHSDTDDTSVVHVPDLGLVVAGDVVYDGAHLFLVESAAGGRDAWRAAIEQIELLEPARLVAGHATRDVAADPRRLIAETRRYLDDVDELLADVGTPTAFFEAMRRRHPDLANPSTLWGSATALYAPSAT